MDKTIMVVHRLPMSIEKEGKKINLNFRERGYASGLESLFLQEHFEWVGWSGLYDEDFTKKEQNEIIKKFKENNCYALSFPEEQHELFHNGFCSETIWPLFHYFTQFSNFHQEWWETYVEINQKYADYISDIIKDNKTNIWIHDYHLMLLPQMIRKKNPNISIGFFLHIPFPSYEIFRLIPWRSELLEGILGADLIGFHTFDYERHFMSCVRRLLGHDSFFNQIRLEERILKVDAFPMGINYEKIEQASIAESTKPVRDKSHILKEIDRYFLATNDERKLILSIARLDYSKGIEKRIKAFEYFLEQNPEMVGKVSLILLIRPFRENVERYQKLKSHVDELVGRINGKFADINWNPIWYFYRTMSFDNMVGLYSACDIALITPNRDGMNLAAKEFVSAKVNKKGVIILSETTGAAKEMNEAIIVNPNNLSEVSEAIKKALTMPEDEQIERFSALQKRLKRYDEQKWIDFFLKSLESVKKLQATKLTKKITNKNYQILKEAYDKASKRIIFLDYDGTLKGFNKDPQMVSPDNELYDILKKLTDDKKNEIVIISGRDKITLGKWFDNKWKIHFIAEHGVWKREPGGEFNMIQAIDKKWKDIVRPVIEFYVDRTPRTFIEEKSFSLAWHYRNADPDLGIQRAWELKDELLNFTANLNLEIMDGDKVLEIKTVGVNKGHAATLQMGDKQNDFVFAIGDDWTDEFTFGAMPEHAFTVKVGAKQTKAKYYVESTKDVRFLLKKFINI